MIKIHYVGFNAYGQCPNNKNHPLPKVINNWTQFSLKEFVDIDCTFKNVLIRTKNNYLIYGVINEDYKINFRTIEISQKPTASLATDDCIIISEGSKIWKSQLSDDWIQINFQHDTSSSESWNSVRIVKICFMQSNEEIIVLDDNGSVWRLDRNAGECKVLELYLPVLDKATDICCGLEHGLILTESGCVMSFGNGSRGQLGHGDLNSSSEPLQVLALGGLKVVRIATGGWHSAAITDSGDLYLWGWNNFGQLTEVEDFYSNTKKSGDGVATIPMLVDIEPNSEMSVVDVACGTRHTVVMTEDENLYSTGWNEYGQLGIEDSSLKTVNTFTKIKLKLGKGKKKLKCGPWSTIVCEEVMSEEG